MATPPIALLNDQLITTISSNADHNSDEQPSSKPALKTQDSLQNTRNFYGAHSDLSSGDSAHHPPSVSSRLRDKVVRAQSNSHISALSPRPTSPSSGPLPTTSPQRSPIPLPTPKGFLTPKKPAAAERLEKSKARRLMPSGVSNVGSTFDAKISGNSEVEGNDALRAPSPFEQYSAVEIPRNQGVRTNSTPERPLPLHSTLTAWETGLATAPRNVAPILASASASQEGWDRSLRHSLITASSPPKGAPMELSSDNLVRREAGEKPSLRDLKRQSHSRTTFERIRHQNNVSKPNRQRKYMSFENPLSTFILGGHVLIGGDTWYSMALVLAMLLGISGVWLGTTGVWMWLHGTEYGLAKGGGIAATIIFVYLFGMTTTSFVVTAFRDPGIIPRRLDPDPPMAQVDDWWEAYPRELTVQNGRVSVKYCETCETYRPPRCSHCRLCGNCVDGIDHHCSYLHTCVGKRNYFSFIVLLITSVCTTISWYTSITSQRVYRTFTSSYYPPSIFPSYVITIISLSKVRSAIHLGQLLASYWGSSPSYRYCSCCSIISGYCCSILLLLSRSGPTRQNHYSPCLSGQTTPFRALLLYRTSFLLHWRGLNSRAGLMQADGSRKINAKLTPH
ncbi:hypothetical protein C349_00256 [Cryptococcus neoformans var. grubii Br795]|nr:hypothetical protein C349_00256 [Cryptococcus neoformans var. grubii Br795]